MGCTNYHMDPYRWGDIVRTFPHHSDKQKEPLVPLGIFKAPNLAPAICAYHVVRWLDSIMVLPELVHAKY